MRSNFQKFRQQHTADYEKITRHYNMMKMIHAPHEHEGYVRQYVEWRCLLDFYKRFLTRLNRFSKMYSLEIQDDTDTNYDINKYTNECKTRIAILKSDIDKIKEDMANSNHL
jgi:hypothetical protein